MSQRFCSRVVIWVVRSEIWVWRVLACAMAVCHCSVVRVAGGTGARVDVLLAFMVMFSEEG